MEQCRCRSPFCQALPRAHPPLCLQLVLAVHYLLRLSDQWTSLGGRRGTLGEVPLPRATRDGKL